MNWLSCLHHFVWHSRVSNSEVTYLIWPVLTHPKFYLCPVARNFDEAPITNHCAIVFITFSPFKLHKNIYGAQRQLTAMETVRSELVRSQSHQRLYPPLRIKHARMTMIQSKWKGLSFELVQGEGVRIIRIIIIIRIRH